MRYLIIDDEPIAHRIIEGYCHKIPYLEKVGNAYDAFEAMEFFHTKEIDLLFLDINMPKMTGFDMLRSLPVPPKVIVTSAYQEFALEGFELNVVDYLLKPFSFSRFMTALHKIAPQTNTPDTDRFFVKVDKQLKAINKKEVLFLEAYGNYVKLHFANEYIVCHQKLSYFEELLSEKDDFIRVHKSFLVNNYSIDVVEGNRIKIEEKEVPIGQKYKSLVYEKLNL
ncbi:LytTR family DNA-binding domain-containing protein [Flammeovirga sp. EKP202]|uniref:LytR/AlgR family response regulator transcription factor n=1 Tax=Flammeovirga sp. EKP202 TaxID=2770592 RepID=UPI00165F9DAD|nr:LytTR family DNA-binding domain-containing protein [Flammeovirga sp. EKP202]MBD0401498.1 response regulator transcription factor [Flammeovirga sp. EKP202]